MMDDDTERFPFTARREEETTRSHPTGSTSPESVTAVHNWFCFLALTEVSALDKHTVTELQRHVSRLLFWDAIFAKLHPGSTASERPPGTQSLFREDIFKSSDVTVAGRKQTVINGRVVISEAR